MSRYACMLCEHPTHENSAESIIRDVGQDFSATEVFADGHFEAAEMFGSSIGIGVHYVLVASVDGSTPGSPIVCGPWEMYRVTVRVEASSARVNHRTIRQIRTEVAP